MKRIVLMVPDRMTYARGTSRDSETETVDTTEENIVNALTMNEYHENYYFEEKDTVRIISIEEA